MKYDKDDEPLSSSAATKYRGMVALMDHLGQDRSDIQLALKELGQDMSSSKQSTWTTHKTVFTRDPQGDTPCLLSGDAEVHSHFRRL